jgi:hypothetical protein
MNDNKMLERVLLMMKYDSSKTLTENTEIVRNKFSQQLNEDKQSIQNAIKAGEKAAAQAAIRQTEKSAAQAAEKAIAKAAVKTMTKSGLSTDEVKQEADIFLKNLKQGRRGPATAAEKAKTLQYADDLASGKIKPQNSAPASKTPTQQPKDGTVNINAPASSKVTVTPKGARGRGKPTPKDKSILSKIGNTIKNNKGKTVLAIAGLGLTTAGIYYYLQPKVSPCLLDSLSEAEIASLGESGTTGKISRAQVGNRLADLNGGLSFNMDNNTVTTGNGKYSGSYSCDGNAIKVSIAGADFVLGSTGNADTGTSGGGGGGTSGGGGGSRYKQCAETFPIAMYCRNSTIARVQGCIGVKQDGAFGPNTSAALVAKGADGSSITQASVDKVCGGGQPEKEKDPSSALSDDFSGQKSISSTTGAPSGDTGL